MDMVRWHAPWRPGLATDNLLITPSQLTDTALARAPPTSPTERRPDQATERGLRHQNATGARAGPGRGTSRSMIPLYLLLLPVTVADYVYYGAHDPHRGVKIFGFVMAALCGAALLGYAAWAVLRRRRRRRRDVLPAPIAFIVSAGRPLVPARALGASPWVGWEGTTRSTEGRAPSDGWTDKHPVG